MKRVFNKARNHREAEEWDIRQQVAMSPADRWKIAKELKRRVYGRRVPPLRRRKA